MKETNVGKVIDIQNKAKKKTKALSRNQTGITETITDLSNVEL
jgi:hypothetical protein